VIDVRMDFVMWWALGVATGVLLLMTVQVIQARREKHPMHYDMPRMPKPTETRNISDWDIQELTPVKVIPKNTPLEVTPVIPPAMQECPECGKAYKRVSQHMRLSHPEKTRLSEDK
jgi:hypothetical protein